MKLHRRTTTRSPAEAAQAEGPKLRVPAGLRGGPCGACGAWRGGHALPPPESVSPGPSLRRHTFTGGQAGCAIDGGRTGRLESVEVSEQQEPKRGRWVEAESPQLPHSLFDNRERKKPPAPSDVHGKELPEGQNLDGLSGADNRGNDQTDSGQQHGVHNVHSGILRRQECHDHGGHGLHGEKCWWRSC
ncbi:unnamed protein product [Pleuronectes platessa]|uniref:Uncharacterized protein n=1 Tax=Pleuronectes platessa TaxID=8262 RepID=A0A9N7UU88_PLEPL|nr:unnamed protein product [Pleuronectes platessa]